MNSSEQNLRLLHSNIVSCHVFSAAEEVFARLDSDGDGSVSVGDVLDQSAANNCSARFLQYFAGADGAYDLSDFVRAVGLVDCPDLSSKCAIVFELS